MKTEKIRRPVERFFVTVNTLESPIEERGMDDPPRRAGSFQQTRKFPLSHSGRFTQLLTYLALLSGLLITTIAHGQLNLFTPPTYAGNGNFLSQTLTVSPAFWPPMELSIWETGMEPSRLALRSLARLWQ